MRWCQSGTADRWSLGSLLWKAEEKCGLALGRPLCDPPASFRSRAEEDPQREFWLEIRSQEAITASQGHSLCQR